MEWRQDWPAAPAPLRPDGALAWIGDGAQVEARIAGVALTAIDAADAARRPAASRPDFLRRRRCLRRVVADLLDCATTAVVIASSPEGQPCVTSHPGVCTSASARGDRIGVALARRPVGLDIEIVEALAQPAWNVLAADERAWLQELAPAARWPAFLTLWTGKEAYLKALGLGLRREPSEIGVIVRGETLLLTDKGRRVQGGGETALLDHPGGGLRVACVVLAAGCDGGGRSDRPASR